MPAQQPVSGTSGTALDRSRSSSLRPCLVCPRLHSRKDARHGCGRPSTLGVGRAIALGVVCGTLLGPIKDVGDVFGSIYGITVAGRARRCDRHIPAGQDRDQRCDSETECCSDERVGTATTKLEAEMARVRLVVVLELVGFLVIFTCMILMRFGVSLEPSASSTSRARLTIKSGAKVSSNADLLLRVAIGESTLSSGPNRRWAGSGKPRTGANDRGEQDGGTVRPPSR